MKKINYQVLCLNKTLADVSWRYNKILPLEETGFRYLGFMSDNDFNFGKY